LFRPSGQIRPPEQRLILPPIIQGSVITPSQGKKDEFLNEQFDGNLLSIDPSDVLYSSLSQPTAAPQQQSTKFGETPVARRERRTQELQRTRLTRNLYH
jgi:hypothetical protein